MAKELNFEEQKKLMKYEHDLMIERMNLQADLNIRQMKEQRRIEEGWQDYNQPPRPPVPQAPAQLTPEEYKYYYEPPQTTPRHPVNVEESQKKYGGVKE